jgi:hypothetical protein
MVQGCTTRVSASTTDKPSTSPPLSAPEFALGVGAFALAGPPVFVIRASRLRPGRDVFAPAFLRRGIRVQIATDNDENCRKSAVRPASGRRTDLDQCWVKLLFAVVVLVVSGLCSANPLKHKELTRGNDEAYKEKVKVKSRGNGGDENGEVI